MSPRVRIRRLRLHLREPFTTSRGTARAITNVLLEITDDHSTSYGEAVPRRTRGYRVSDCARSLQRWFKDADPLPDLASRRPEEMLSSFHGPAPARAALDMALHDAWARRRGVGVAPALAELYDLRPGPLPPTSHTIGIDTIDRMVEKARAAVGYPILKVKLGTDRDLAIVAAIRSVSDAEIRIDANGAWTCDETRAKAERLAALGVSLLEQPLRADDLRGYRELFGTLPMPVIADESCRAVQDMERLEGAVDGINIKLSKVGGLYEGARMTRAARTRGMLVMVGCFAESSLAITAASALAPYADFVDLDGASFLAHDPFRGVTIERGRLAVPPGPGLGVSRREAAR